MFKSVLVLFHLLAILLFPVIISSDITIKSDIPSSLAPGEERIVNVSISKGKIQGFAKYQVNVPEGLSISMEDGKGASFTFIDQKAKFIWMALPEAETFTFQYKISANKNAKGSLKVKARFSYIEDNERKNFDEEQKTISIGSSSSTTETDLTQEPKPQEETPGEEINKTPISVVAERIITAEPKNRYRVDIRIIKQNLSGFARVEETIPQGYTAINLGASGAVFNLDEPKVKYLWSNLPESEEVLISYKLIPLASDVVSNPDLTGDFEFLQGNETISIPVETISGGDLAEENTTAPTDNKVSDQKENTGNNITPTPSEKEPVEDIAEEKAPETKSTTTPADKKDESPKTKPVVAEQPTTKPKKPSGEMGNIVVDVPDPDRGVNYRVQIAAGKNNVAVELFKKQFNFLEPVYIETGGSWIKYTTGNFPVYKEARDDRERIKQRYPKFQGPFVAAYNDGERITVQEALMITRQKWYQ